MVYRRLNQNTPIARVEAVVRRVRRRTVSIKNEAVAIVNEVLDRMEANDPAMTEATAIRITRALDAYLGTTVRAINVLLAAAEAAPLKRARRAGPRRRNAERANDHA